ncbi:MAG: hypothetical protein ACK4IX_05140 [Candidatus Sericytochromatia bacterium]
MRFIKILFYFSSLFVFFLSLKIAYGDKINIFYFWDISSLISIIAAFAFSIINFKLSEIISAIKSSISIKEENVSNLKKNKIIIKSLWTKTITMANIVTLIFGVILFSYISDTSKIGPSLAVMAIVYIYALALKIFIFTPLEISIDKKIILKNNK